MLMLKTDLYSAIKSEYSEALNTFTTGLQYRAGVAILRCRLLEETTFEAKTKNISSSYL